MCLAIHVFSLAVIIVWLTILAGFSTLVMGAQPRIIKQPEDVNVHLDDKTLELQCKVAGEPTPNITWYANDLPLETRGQNYRVSSNGNLFINPLRLSDAGYYWCVATNSYGQQKSRDAKVKIDANATIQYGPSNRRVEWGTEIRMDCKAFGLPIPQISWYMDGKPLPDKTGKISSLPVLVVNATRSASYTCLARNYVSKYGDVVVNVTGHVTVVVTPQPDPKKSEGICSYYTGSLCEPVYNSRPSRVFFNFSLGSTPADIENRLQESWMEQESIITQRCRDVVLRILCHLALPDCASPVTESSLSGGQQLSHLQPRVLPLCREYCSVIHNFPCVESLWRAAVSSQLTRGDLSRLAPLPNCNALPNGLDNSASCTSPDLFVVDDEQVTTNCYRDDGQMYDGDVKHSLSGLPCLPWEPSLVKVFPILRQSGNRCRNPGGWRDSPWCFVATSGSNNSWEYCHIIRCEEGKNGTGVVQPEMYPTHNTLQQALIIGGVAVLIICLIFLLACVSYNCVINNRFRRRFQHSSRQEHVELMRPFIQNNNIISTQPMPDDNENLQLFTSQPVSLRVLNLDTSNRPPECSINRILIMRELGQGAFGIVYLARVFNLLPTEEQTNVAVKTLRIDAADMLVHDFEREASLISQLNHVNIVRLLAVCTTSEPLSLIFEYMNRGDLHDFLLQSKTSHFISRQRTTVRQSSSDSEDSGRRPRISLSQQLNIAVQIANGMRYFSSRRYVHRDLATRNCLVSDQTTDGSGEELVIKIADFGLSRPLDPDSGTYEGKECEPIPVRWLPFESIVFNLFSPASDVWSFGVLMWEIFSFAKLPYDDLTHDEVVRHLGSENVLSIPDNTPTDVYDIMLQCWRLEPDLRPSFDVVCEQLQRLEREAKQRIIGNSLDKL